MNDWTGRIIILLLLAVIIGVPLAMKPAAQAIEQGEDIAKLVVITPHNEQIRYEIARAFNRHRAAQGLSRVVFDWRSSGGTSDLRKQVIEEYKAEGLRALKQNRQPGGVGYDLFFGGGDYDHNKLAEDITLTDDDDKSRVIKFSPSIPVEFPPGMLEEIFPQPDIAGANLYHPKLKWVGIVLSSFGIVYNNDRIAQLGLAAPTTWTDLIDPRYQSEVALADPSHSGSIGEAYNAILMRLGWDEGWKVLRRVFANARYFSSVSTKVSVDVSTGQAATGMSIDFYGRFQASAVSGSTGQALNRLGYIDPPGMTKQNGDPVSILHGAPHHKLANDFVLWLLSKEAQRIWNRKRGTEDGPELYELRRQPIRRDMYVEEEMKYWTDELQPFAQARAFSPGMPNFYSYIATISHAMAIDIHDDLIAAWKAINACTDEKLKAELIEIFDRMPAELVVSNVPANWREILDDPKHAKHATVAASLKKFTSDLSAQWKTSADAMLMDRLAWTAFFRANYREVVAKARAGK